MYVFWKGVDLYRVVHAVDTDTVRAMCKCLSRHWSLTFLYLELVQVVYANGCVPALILKHSRSFFILHVLSWVGSWVCLYWISCVQRRRCGGSTTYKVQPRRHEGVWQIWWALQLIARLCETCMHRTSTLVLVSALLLPDWTRENVLLEFPSSRNRFPSLPPFSLWPKTVFPRFPKSLNHSLTPHLLIYQCSIRGCSKQISGDLTLRIPTERVTSTARTCKLKFYIENKRQKLFEFRSALSYGYPSPEVSCMNFFLAFEALLLQEGKLSVCSSRMHHVYPSNEPNARTRRNKTPWGAGSKI